MTLTIRSVVTTPRGSWKWQNAYRVALYQPTRTRDGRLIWRNVGYATGKKSEPQLRGIDAPWGGLHNTELTPAQRSAVVFAEAGLL